MSIITTRTARPYLTLTLTTLGLIVFLGTVGTISYLLGFTGYLPLAVAFIPLAAAIAIGLSIRHTWNAVGFRSVSMDRRRTVVAMTLAALLPIAVLACSSGIAVSGAQLLPFAALALLVGFVEETIFRGILRRILLSRGRVQTIAATSVGFAIAHTATALSPDQTGGATVRTIVFALVFGIVASLLVETTTSIWPAIALHACFDFAGFILLPRSTVLTDLVSIGVAAVLAVTLIFLSRRGR